MRLGFQTTRRCEHEHQTRQQDTFAHGVSGDVKGTRCEGHNMRYSTFTPMCLNMRKERSRREGGENYMT